MRFALSALLLCSCTTSPAPSPLDGSTDRGQLAVPVGGACSDRVSTWCADYEGVCVSSVCRQQCSITAYPRCPAGTVEEHTTLATGEMSCHCVPG
jgi:hypothetical protein